tara:strand:+ start:1143 stop:1706 length:564 start_codon:yes stop_codon:yes gene_type:complete
MYKVIFLLLVIYVCLFSNCKEGMENYEMNKHSSLLNIYGEPLHSCKTDSSNGSWDSKGYCSEMGGGVHQICFKVTDETKDFSTDTGQSDWSKKRVDNNHCMCLGAFALYKAKGKGTGQELQCESIMEHALDESYVGNWGTWNGNEVDGQIVHGVNEIMDQCYKGTSQQKEYLQNLYQNLYQNLTRDR